MGDNNYYISLIRKFIPESTYKESNCIVFKNREGEILKFKLSFDEFKIADLDGNSFNKEVYTLRDPNNTNYHLSITAQPELHEKIIYERLYVELLTTINQGLTPSIIIYQDGESWFNTKEKNLDLLGKTFHDVYISEITKEDVVACNKLYYTHNEGIVGFTDDKGALWVFHDIK
jgi:hypothetical protein